MNLIERTNVAKALELTGFRHVPPASIYDNISAMPVLLKCVIPAATYAAGAEIEFTEADSVQGRRILPIEGTTEPEDEYAGAIGGLSASLPYDAAFLEANQLRGACDVVLYSGDTPVPCALAACLVVGGSTVTIGKVSGNDSAPGAPNLTLPAPLAWPRPTRVQRNKVTLRFNEAVTTAAISGLQILVFFGGAPKADDPKADLKFGYRFGDAVMKESSARDVIAAIRAARNARMAGKSVHETIKVEVSGSRATDDDAE